MNLPISESSIGIFLVEMNLPISELNVGIFLVKVNLPMSILFGINLSNIQFPRIDDIGNARFYQVWEFVGNKVIYQEKIPNSQTW